MTTITKPGAVPAAPKDSMKSSKNKKTLLRVLITLFLVIYTVITLTPFYFLFVRSFVSTKDSTALHLWIPPEEEVSLNYKYGNMSTYFNLDLQKFKQEMGLSGYINPNMTMQQIADKYGIDEQKIKDYLRPLIRYNGFYTILQNGFLRSVGNTVIIAGGTILLGATLSIMTGSVLAGFQKGWHRRVYNLYIASMIIPSTVTMLPCYMIVRNLGLYDNHLALILMGAQGGAIPIMIFTSFIATIPKELRESVEIDGGSRMTYFWHILLPNMATPFASYVAITLPNVWNNMLNGVLYLSPKKQPITALISSLSGTYATNYQAMYSGLLMSIIPLLIIYLLFQNLFVQSAMQGAVKG